VAIDQRSAKLLHNVYDNDETLGAEDLSYLENVGLVPKRDITVAHNDVITRLRAIASTVELANAANVFVAACVSAEVQWRSVLPALSVAFAMPEHGLDDWSRGMCRVCFLYENNTIDSTARAFANFRHGGVLDGNPIDALLALEIAGSEPTWPAPTPRDIWVFHRVLDTLRTLPANARYSKARSAIVATKLLAHGSVAHCMTWLEQLALMGILETPDRPGMFTAFTNALNRDERPNVRIEPPAPLAWWRAADGVNEELVDRLFGHLQRPVKEPRAAPKPESTSDSGPKRAPKTVMPPQVGHVYAVKTGSSWTGVYCHEVNTNAKGVVIARIEFIDVFVDHVPTASEVTGRAVHDRYDGRWQGWCSSLGITAGVRLVAERVETPKTGAKTPDRIAFCRAAELRHFATSHFSA
jgi:hypothetical protein